MYYNKHFYAAVTQADHIPGPPQYNAYARAGVNEYWIADLTEQNIEVLIREDRKYLSTGIFSGEQPVRSPLLPDFSVQAKQFFDYD